MKNYKYSVVLDAEHEVIKFHAICPICECSTDMFLSIKQYEHFCKDEQVKDICLANQEVLKSGMCYDCQSVIFGV